MRRYFQETKTTTMTTVKMGLLQKPSELSEQIPYSDCAKRGGQNDFHMSKEATAKAFA